MSRKLPETVYTFHQQRFSTIVNIHDHARVGSFINRLKPYKRLLTNGFQQNQGGEMQPSVVFMQS